MQITVRDANIHNFVITVHVITVPTKEHSKRDGYDKGGTVMTSCSLDLLLCMDGGCLEGTVMIRVEAEGRRLWHLFQYFVKKWRNLKKLSQIFFVANYITAYYNDWPNVPSKNICNWRKKKFTRSQSPKLTNWENHSNNNVKWRYFAMGRWNTLLDS